jgi:hypothetical protein
LLLLFIIIVVVTGVLGSLIEARFTLVAGSCIALLVRPDGSASREVWLCLSCDRGDVLHIVD